MVATPRLVRRAWNAALEQVLPPRCGVCGGFGELLCLSCAAALPRAAGPRCARCWQPSAAGECPRCAAYGSPCTGVRAAVEYGEGAKRLVGALKYRGVFAYAGPIGQMMAVAWPAFGLAADLVVPVPLHPRRERSRGFNQAGLIGEALAQRARLPVAARALVRRDYTPPQARAGGRVERARNIHGAFTCAEAAVVGRRVLLVDDVTTTGATFQACAVALFAAGAAEVYGYAFAVR